MAPDFHSTTLQAEAEAAQRQAKQQANKEKMRLELLLHDLQVRSRVKLSMNDRENA